MYTKNDSPLRVWTDKGMGFVYFRLHVFGSLPLSLNIGDNITILRELDSGHPIPLFLSARVPSLTQSSTNSGKPATRCPTSSRLRIGSSRRGCLCSQFRLSFKDEAYTGEASHENSALVPERRRSYWVESISLAFLILVANCSLAVAAPVRFVQVNVGGAVLATSEVEVGKTPVLIEKAISLPTFSPNVNGDAELTNEIVLDIEHHIGIVVEEEVQPKQSPNTRQANTAEAQDPSQKTELGVSKELLQGSDLAKLLRGESSESLPKQGYWTGWEMRTESLTQLPGEKVSKPPSAQSRPSKLVEPRKPADIFESAVVVASRQRPKGFVVKPKTTIFDYYPDDLDVDFDRHVSEASRGSIHKPRSRRSCNTSRRRLARILRHRRITVSSQVPEIVRYYEGFQRLRRVMVNEVSRDPLGSVGVQRAERGGPGWKFTYVSKYELIHSVAGYIQQLDRRLSELDMDAKQRKDGAKPG